MAETKDEMKIRLEAQIAELQADKEHLQKENAQLIDDGDALNERYQKLAEEHDALSHKHQQLMSDVVAEPCLPFDEMKGEKTDDVSAWLDVPSASDALTKVQAYYIGQTGKHGVMIRTIAHNGNIDIKPMVGIKCRDNGDGTVDFLMA